MQCARLPKCSAKGDSDWKRLIPENAHTSLAADVCLGTSSGLPSCRGVPAVRNSAIEEIANRLSGGEFRPLILLAGYSACPRLVNFALMREIADEVLIGDFSLVGRAQIIATTTHKSLRGPRGGNAAALATNCYAGAPR